MIIQKNYAKSIKSLPKIIKKKNRPIYQFLKILVTKIIRQTNKNFAQVATKGFPLLFFVQFASWYYYYSYYEGLGSRLKLGFGFGW